MGNVIFEHEYFRVIDKRRGDDWEDPDVQTRVIDPLIENADAWNELFELVIRDPEFSTPWNLRRIDVEVKGYRKSYLGRAHRSEGWIRITPCSGYCPESVSEVMVHELAHLAIPIERAYSAGRIRRIIHGRKYKTVAYRLAQYAHAIGLLPESSIRRDIGMSIHKGERASAASKKPKTKNAFKVGDRVAWTHTGHKHGGDYTGIIKRVNKKTYTVIEQARNGEGSPFHIRKWRIGKNSNLTLIE